jgi:hypothetical protein
MGNQASVLAVLRVACADSDQGRAQGHSRKNPDSNRFQNGYIKEAGPVTWVIPWTFAPICGLGRVDGIAFQLLYL